MPISIRDRQTAWSILTSAADDTLTAINQMEQQITTIRTSEIWTSEHKAKLIEEQHTNVKQAAEETLRRVTSARDTLLTAAAELDSPRGDATMQLLAETRAQRAWARVQLQLAAGVHWQSILDQAVASRDAGTVLALRDELPAYLQATASMAAGGDMRRAAQPLDIGRTLDIAAFKTMGDDNGPGTAARLRLHAELRYPLAHSVISQAVLGRDLTRAMSIEFAKRDVAAVEAQIGAPVA